MKPRVREHVVPCTTAAAVVLLVTGATVWSAWPIRVPIEAEFRWPAIATGIAGVLSLGATAAALWPAARLSRRVGPRTVVALGCLLAGALMLLAIPNLTHYWQLLVTLLVLGPIRALALAGAWLELRRPLPARLAAGVCAAATLLGAAVITPWVSQVVYLNSWREGVAASAGVLILVATPLSYILLRGHDYCSGECGSP